MSNVFIFTGRIGNDAEIRYTKDGSAVCSFSVANDIGCGDKKQTQWIRVNIFGRLAESGLVQYLTKGQEVFVSGELKLNEYESKDEKRASLEVAANVVNLVGDM